MRCLALALIFVAGCEGVKIHAADVEVSYSKDCQTAQLHQELTAAGVQVVTVRGSSATLGGPCQSGVVVCKEGTDTKKVQDAIAAHVPAAAPKTLEQRVADVEAKVAAPPK